MGEQMKAIAFVAPEVVEHCTVADPRLLEDTDALVRVCLAGVCGSDLHIYHGRETGLDTGTVLGHEFVGEVLEVGPAVRDLGPGDRVASPFSTSCGACFFCLSGLTSRCVNGQLFGWVENGEGLHGAQAEVVRVPLATTTLVCIPDDLTDELALLAGDVLSTGCYCAERAGIQPGETVAVIGCGPVGLMAAVLALESPAEMVFAIDLVPERLELAAGFGARVIDASREDPREVVGSATEGRGADRVLEAVGSDETSRLAVELVRPGGTVSAVGVHCSGSFPFSPVLAYDKNLTYRIGRSPARHYLPRMLTFAAANDHDLAAVISHRLPLEDGPRGYEIFSRREEGCTKVVLVP